MRFIDILYIMLILGMLSASLIRFGNQFIQLDEKEENIDIKKESLCFISGSFINTCKGNGFDSLETWQKTCKAMWALDYIAWSDADSFCPVEKGLCYYGSWSGSQISGDVFCFIGSEK